MLEIEVTPRKWGNSVGFTLPKDIIAKAHIKPDKPITIYVQEKPFSLRDIFGTCPFKEPTLKMLREIRKGEE